MFFSIVLIGCASVRQNESGGVRVKTLTYSTIDEEPFYVQNADCFVEKKLSNGIPVVVKKSKNQKDCGVRLVIDTVPVQNPRKKAGLESITFEMMKKGTEKYSPLYISSLEYTDSTKFISKVHQDYIEYGIISQKENLSSVLDVFTQVYRKPLMTEDSFNEIYAEAKQHVSPVLSNLYNTLNSIDPYFTSTAVTDQSDITYKDTLNYHQGMLNSSRIKIIASGNFSDEEVTDLVNSLEVHFSSIKKASYTSKNPSKQKLMADGILSDSMSVNKSPFCYIGFSPVPYPLSNEYLTFGILSLYLDDSLYSLLKEKYGYASDAGCGVILCKSCIALISIYDAPQKKKIDLACLNELVDELTEIEIEKKLEYYKRIYTSFVMNSESSAEKTLDQMASSLIFTGSASEYIKRPFAISKITAGQIRKQLEVCLQDVKFVSGNLMTK